MTKPASMAEIQTRQFSTLPLRKLANLHSECKVVFGPNEPQGLAFRLFYRHRTPVTGWDHLRRSAPGALMTRNRKQLLTSAKV